MQSQLRCELPSSNSAVAVPTVVIDELRIVLNAVKPNQVLAGVRHALLHVGENRATESMSRVSSSHNESVDVGRPVVVSPGPDGVIVHNRDCRNDEAIVAQNQYFIVNDRSTPPRSRELARLPLFHTVPDQPPRGVVAQLGQLLGVLS